MLTDSHLQTKVPRPLLKRILYLSAVEPTSLVADLIRKKRRLIRYKRCRKQQHFLFSGFILIFLQENAAGNPVGSHGFTRQPKG